jgi:hypothetical protein
MTVVPTHPDFLFPRLKIKLKGLHVDPIAVMHAESQALLNISKKKTSTIHSKNGSRSGNGA